jgi:hypothetical protein
MLPQPTLSTPGLLLITISLITTVFFQSFLFFEYLKYILANIKFNLGEKEEGKRPTFTGQPLLDRHILGVFL